MQAAPKPPDLVQAQETLEDLQQLADQLPGLEAALRRVCKAVLAVICYTSSVTGLQVLQIPSGNSTAPKGVHLAEPVARAAADVDVLGQWLSKCARLSIAARADWAQLQGATPDGLAEQRAALWAATQRASRHARLIDSKIQLLDCPVQLF